MNRQELEQEALRVVCTCWYYELADNINELDDTELYGVIGSPYYLHLQNQIHDPVSEEEYSEELDSCPDLAKVAV